MFYTLWILLALPIVGIFVVWIYARLTCGHCSCDRSRMAGKTVIVTGGNKGIGRCTVEELCRGGARVLIGCRNVKQTEELAADCAQKQYPGTVEVHRLDLQSLASVRTFVGWIKSLNTEIDILINNAGVGVPEHLVDTDDGFEVTMQTNFLSPVLLTHSLLPLLKRSSRIINVSSIQHQMGSNDRLRKNSACSESMPCFGSFVYGDSKLALIHWSQVLARKIRPSGITVHSCHPGYVDTEIFSNHYGNFLHYALRLFAHIFAKSPLEGAQTTLHLALSMEAGFSTGHYWADCRVVPGARSLQDEETSSIVWSRTLSQLGLVEL